MRSGGFQLPPVTPLVRNVLIVLFALYVVELLARNAMSLPIDALSWHAFGQGFALWQPVTRYLVQGNAVLGVVLGGVVLYFFVPAMQRMFELSRVIEALIAGAIGGTVVGMILDAAGLAGGVATGWQPLITVLLVLFGLKIPDASILLFFILPIPAKVIAWGTGAIAFLMLLATFDLASADYFGTWLGAVAWWYTRGPAGRRRKLMRDASRIEQELQRFQVLDGGKGDDGDDWVH